MLVHLYTVETNVTVWVLWTVVAYLRVKSSMGNLTTNYSPEMQVAWKVGLYTAKQMWRLIDRFSVRKEIITAGLTRGTFPFIVLFPPSFSHFLSHPCSSHFFVFTCYKHYFYLIGKRCPTLTPSHLDP